MLIEVVLFALPAIIFPEEKNQQNVKKSTRISNLTFNLTPPFFVIYNYSEETFQHSLPDFCKHCTYHTKYSIKIKGKLRC